jgi:hypothetical protein
MAIKYNLVGSEDQQNITVVLDGEMYVANSDNPNWHKIVQKVISDDADGLADLFSPAKAVENNFKAVTERVSVQGSTILFDGDPVDNALTKQIIRFLDEGVEDWKPLVAFMEKVQQNPEQHSREQLYEWLSRHDFAIDDEGNIVAYKSVYRLPGGGYKSYASGTAWVNGIEHKNKQIPQNVGDIVTMPRSEVAFDPSQACSAGLHVASHNYASNFLAGEALLHVRVNPRDVVSVPTDSHWEKVRVCRYEIIGEGEKVESASYSGRHRPAVDADDVTGSIVSALTDWYSDYDDDEDSWDSWDDEDSWLD